MNGAGDKMVTNGNADSKGRSRKGGKAGPIATVKFGSASVPIYLSESKGRKRYFIAHHRDGKRIRKAFPDLAAAKKEAQFVAQRIQSGMQHVTDMKPHERDSYVAAMRVLENSGVPLVAAVEDYMRAREKAGTESLAAMADEYGRLFKKVVRRASTAEIVDEMLKQREQDGASKVYLRLLKTTLTRFAAKFPGDLIEVDSHQIDAWLRSLDVELITRNSMLRCIKIFFSYARSRNYLPEDRKTAAENLKVSKVVTENSEIFTPETMARILHHSPADLIPILAIGAFSGIRMAELNRLDWSAVDLDRRIIELRAGQAKTGSRRVIPITDNLAAWLEPLERKGKVVPSVKAHHRAVYIQPHTPSDPSRQFQHLLLFVEMRDLTPIIAVSESAGFSQRSSSSALCRCTFLGLMPLAAGDWEAWAAASSAARWWLSLRRRVRRSLRAWGVMV